MGIHQWREEDDSPLPRTSYTRYYLAQRRPANSSSGDETLSISIPHGENQDTFTHDPGSPVPTRVGALCCLHDQVVQEPSGTFDQREVKNATTVLIYTTGAFQRDFEVTGPISAEIYVTSSAPDTDLREIRFRGTESGNIVPGACP